MVKKTAGFLIAEPFPVGRIADEHTSAGLEEYLLQRPDFNMYLAFQLGLPDMPNGQLYSFRINIRAGNRQVKVRNGFMCSILAKRVKRNSAERGKRLHRKMPSKSGSDP